MDTVKKTFCKVTMLVLSLLLTVTLSTPAIADVTYTYTGSPFTIFFDGSTSPPWTNLTLSFTESTALAPSTVYDLTSAPPTYAFAAGGSTWTSANSHDIEFLVTTGTTGQIVAWYIRTENAAGTVGTSWMAPVPGAPYSGVDVVETNVNPSTGAENVNAPGVWGASVPEPSTMLLLGSGLIGLVGFRKKFKN